MSKKCRGSYVIYNFIQTFEKYFKCNMFELFIHLFKKQRDEEAEEFKKNVIINDIQLSLNLFKFFICLAFCFTVNGDSITMSI